MEPGPETRPHISSAGILERMNRSNRNLRMLAVVAAMALGVGCGQYYGVHDRAAGTEGAELASSHGDDGSSSPGASKAQPDIAGDDGAEGPGPNAITGDATSSAPIATAPPTRAGGKQGGGSTNPNGGSGSKRGEKGSNPSGTQPVYRIPESVEAVLRAGADYRSKVLPAGFPFLICPVQGPYSYSDDFGAPRYAGGYHPHAGNDIFSNMGTPLVAPFDGYVEKDPNTLGGLAVKVAGPLGYVYMAHLVDYSPLVPGPVRAGDVVGFVGNTGDAQGTSPHDHFEWHPKTIQSYDRVIPGTNGAVDPFRYLVIVCRPG
jgi:murein DD-endopeptidase MepM/ murein hydrolase activator NlpD